jgi:hypothetical protein
VLDGFGSFPAVFMQHRAGSTDLVWFGLLVMLLPAALVTAACLGIGLISRRVRNTAHIVAVVVLGGVGGWRLAFEHTSPGSLVGPLVLVGVVVGGCLGWLRRWPKTADPTASFLRIAGGASVVFLAQFLFMSESSKADLLGDRASEAVAAAEVAERLPEDTPPVVMVVVFDALPTGILLDGSGAVDADLYPNFAELAGTSTWHRNNTSVTPFTNHAVPAILTGRYPDEAGVIDHPGQNLFSLLGAGYDLHVNEPWTDLCHSRFCPDVPTFSGQGGLLREAVSFWRSGTDGSDGPWLPERITQDRYEESAAWIDGTVAAVAEGEGRPPFVFLHAILPHRPRELTDEGVRYEGAGVTEDSFADWGSWGAATGRQAHVLQTQATDKLLGELIDGLKEEGVYDEALVVVTADHGEAFLAEQPARMVTDENWPYLMWTPLFVKVPGQTDGEVDDRNMQTVDIVPTIADVLDIDLPWAVDGLTPAAGADQRDPGEKPFVVIDPIREHAAGEGRLVFDGEEGLAQVLDESATEHSGPDAAWKRTAHAELLRASVEDLVVEDPVVEDPHEAELAFEVPADLDAVDLDESLPLEVVAGTELEAGTTVALVLDGQVAALVDVEAGSPNRVHALLLPELFVQGENDLDAYVVEGSPGDEVLTPLDVVL